MFDDMTDEEYEEWKDWYDSGMHDVLASALIGFLSFMFVLMLLKEFT